MKPNYLDKKNCHALLPKQHGLPMLQRLENCLSEINEKPGIYHGLIDKLIKQNKSTANKRHGSERLLNIPIDIAQGLYVVKKEINTEVRSRPYPGPAQLHTVIDYEGDTVWKTLVPLQFLLKGWGDANSGHQCYVHSISKNVPRIASIDQFLSRLKKDEDTYYYVGITGRNWLQRLSEHIRETRRGSQRWFYKALRESSDWKKVLYISTLMDINQSYDEAMHWEEEYVENIAADQYGLNMIPGGFKGNQYLHKLGLAKKVRLSLEEREHALNEYAKQNSRRGIPNLFKRAWWKDDNNYEKFNEANPKRLTVDQRKEARRLHAAGISIPDIKKIIGALDERQVKDFLSGKTYKRSTV
ncbi:MAG: hypothetical protein RIB78_02270 [Gammaproteobacteria bacterium]